jgi:hypothetical protein
MDTAEVIYKLDLPTSDEATLRTAGLDVPK